MKNSPVSVAAAAPVSAKNASHGARVVRGGIGHALQGHPPPPVTLVSTGLYRPHRPHATSDSAPRGSSTQAQRSYATHFSCHISNAECLNTQWEIGFGNKLSRSWRQRQHEVA